MKSDAITKGFEKTGHRALLHATGVTFSIIPASR